MDGANDEDDTLLRFSKLLLPEFSVAIGSVSPLSPCAPLLLFRRRRFWPESKVASVSSLLLLCSTFDNEADATVCTTAICFEEEEEEEEEEEADSIVA